MWISLVGEGASFFLSHCRWDAGWVFVSEELGLPGWQEWFFTIRVPDSPVLVGLDLPQHQGYFPWPTSHQSYSYCIHQLYCSYCRNLVVWKCDCWEVSGTLHGKLSVEGRDTWEGSREDGGGGPFLHFVSIKSPWQIALAVRGAMRTCDSGMESKWHLYVLSHSLEDLFHSTREGPMEPYTKLILYPWVAQSLTLRTEYKNSGK